MPFKSEKQRKAFQAAAHSKKAADFMGVSQATARKMVKHDESSAYRKKQKRERRAAKLTDKRPGY